VVFSTWANELGTAKPDAIKVALARREANADRHVARRDLQFSDCRTRWPRADFSAF
jgi:hypothetical protein